MGGWVGICALVAGLCVGVAVGCGCVQVMFEAHQYKLQVGGWVGACWGSGVDLSHTEASMDSSTVAERAADEDQLPALSL